MNLEVSIIVPDKVFLKLSSNEVILPTITGQMGILKDHMPLLTGLDTGLLMIRQVSDNKWIPIAIMSGFSLINNNKLIILVNEAEIGSDINIEDAQSQFLKFKMSLENDTTTDSKKKIEILSSFKRARARFQAAEKALELRS